MHIDFRSRLSRDPWFLSGAFLALLFVFLTFAGPWLAVHDPQDMSFQSFSPPSAEHWLGVNDAGMDLFSELMLGIKNTAAFGLLSGLVCLALGVVLGLISAWFRGFLDLILMRLSEVLMAVPAIMILILLAAFFRPEPWLMALVLAGLSWPSIAKVIRAQALTLKGSLHIKAARQMGASSLYIIRRHLLPELYPLYLIGFASKARMAIFMEASLGFLGLFDPSRKSLGMMINQGLQYYYMDIWWNWLLPPILSLSLLIMSVTFLAISLEKIFDPRLREAV
ncbi:MAG: ABC transporter permease [Thermodesulfobacteriota bacterium]